MSPCFYLASSSPRRFELLSLLNIPFEVVKIDVPEIIGKNEQPKAYVTRLSIEKAKAGAINSNSNLPVIGADTIGVIDNLILEKPKDSADAIAMLQKLSGNTHIVYTGVSIANQQTVISQCFETFVTFRKLSLAEIEGYVELGEGMDKAGSYGIQGIASTFVTELRGSYQSVIGLPVAQVKEMLEKFIGNKCA